MADETVKLALGGQSWTVEPPAFGALMRLQPKYLAFADVLANRAAEVPTSPELMGEMCEIVRQIIVAGTDAPLEKEAFEGLRFSMSDLAGAFNALAAVIGLTRAAPGEQQPAAQAPPAKAKRPTGKS